jgi:hypothetical protein
MPTTPTVTHILWSWSWSGFSVKFSDGTSDTISAAGLVRLVGEAEYDRLNRIAHQFPCNCYKAVN